MTVRNEIFADNDSKHEHSPMFIESTIVPPEPLKGFSDAIFVESRIHLTATDRLRVLFGGIIALRSMVNTKTYIGETKTVTEVRIE